MSSLPGSPLVARKTRMPITPQGHAPSARLARTHHAGYSPVSNTPLSLRSVSSANTSIATPPSAHRSGIADIADNWRVKPPFADIADFADDADDEDELEALLPSAALHLRPRAQTYVPPTAPPILRASTRHMPILPQAQSPLTQRARRANANAQIALTSTPPRNPALANQLRLRGSVTDPAGGRLGAGRMQTMDLQDLFHISEDEQEDDAASIDTNPESHPYYDEDAYFPAAFGAVPDFYSSSPQTMSHSYSQSFTSSFDAPDHYSLAFMPQMRTSTPPPPGYAPRSPEFVRKENALVADMKKPLTPKPTACSVCGVAFSGSKLTLAILSPCNHPLCSSCLTSALNIVGEKDMECAVCYQSVHDFKLTTIDALPHTGTNFQSPSPQPTPTKKRLPLGAVDTNSRPEAIQRRWDELSEDSFSDSPIALHRLKRDVGISHSVFDENSFALAEIQATPAPAKIPTTSTEVVVLRIDNVPWDITPPMISEWLSQPEEDIERVHVLLDRKGKTLSHAYVEVKGQETARRILRGEIARSGAWRPKTLAGSDTTPKKRSGVLGKGRRARGVTVTRSSQEELMAALFPSWPGTFTGSRPTVAGLHGDGVRLALERGLITEGEIGVLVGLIRVGEESHFLKVPTLPFYSLMSLLAKCPSDRDSRVFWNATLKGMVFDVTVAALQTLYTRLNDGKTVYNGLPEQIVKTCMTCEAFSVEQKAHLQQLLTTLRDGIRSQTAGQNSLSSEVQARCDTPAALTDPQPPQTPRRGSPALTKARPASTPPSSATVETFDLDLSVESTSNAPTEEGSDTSMDPDLLAKEYGVDPGIVKALLKRMSTSSAA
ncbi:hypothetical protein DL96DRAFT_1813663 [Flagelloscypha sp. PMI_526]|nr:hypothetical protein DL96DRAFT_1813663 [Flagelloscypha sp. PMI_526]